MDEVGVRLPVGPQVSERGHFRSGFLWQRAKKTTDFAARRALRARGGRFKNTKPKIFWREDFLEKNANAEYSGVLAPPARARTRLFFAEKSKSAKLPEISLCLLKDVSDAERIASLPLFL